MEKYDLLIAGAGPAGLTLAWSVAKEGYKVLVLDQKEKASSVHYHTTGSTIDRQRWNIPKRIVYHIDRVSLFGPTTQYSRSEKEVLAPLSKEYFRKSCVIQRPKLLDLLHKRARKAGVEFRWGSWPHKVQISDNMISSVTWETHKKEFGDACAEIFADCSGTGRAIEHHFPIVGNNYRLGTGVEYMVNLKSEPRTLDLYFGRYYQGGYGWLFPLSGDIAILGWGTLLNSHAQEARKSLDGMLTLPRVKKRVSLIDRNISAGEFRLGPVPSTFVRSNLLIAGDMALQANPLLGEGVRFVMDAASMASGAVCEALESHDLTELHQYTRKWREKYLAMYTWGLRLRRLFIMFSGSDRLTDFAIKRAKRIPEEYFGRIVAGEVDSRIVYHLMRCLMPV